MLRLLSILTLLTASAVVATPSDTTKTVDSTTTRVDTVLFDPGKRLDNIAAVNVPVDFETRRTQNPTTALFKSMAVPGWGQVGNRSYTKAVIFAGLQAWFVGSAIHYGNQANEFRNKYEATTDKSARNEWYGLYTDRRDERNKFTWFAVLLTFVGMFDAYVDAHLSAYPSDEKQREAGFGISLPENGTTGLTLTWKF